LQSHSAGATSPYLVDFIHPINPLISFAGVSKECPRNGGS
jgi:hypothetical protein